MPHAAGRNAVVIGAGIGGLAAAAAAAPFFDKVTLVDRDTLPERPTPRAGTPQARHAHALLAGGERALSALFPDIVADFVRDGAVKTRAGLDVIVERPGYDPFPRRDIGLDVFCLSRPLLENVCRRRINAMRNIEIRSHSWVIEIVASKAGDGVAAVRYETDRGEMETLPADLVVDASGRAAPTLAFLDSLGLPTPEVTEIGVDLGYSSGIFEIPGGAAPDWKGVQHLPSAPDFSRCGVLLPIENGRWIVSLGGGHGDSPPSDLEGFLDFARTLRTPTIYEAIRSAKPVGDIVRFLLPASLRRHFDKLARFPRGLIPIGDSICRFNPVYGQGMSVAAMEAAILSELLASRSGRNDPLDGLARDYLNGAQACFEAPWATAELDFVYPQTRGDRPPDLDRRLKYGDALMRLMAEDADVHKLFLEVSYLLESPAALREPPIANRVMALMNAAAA
jgi:2-polyprenyl-6-methoxyphenol hydroxylase-like FAD-dependent oxidoreductase